MSENSEEQIVAKKSTQPGLAFKIARSLKGLEQVRHVFQKKESKPIPFWTEYKLMVPYVALRKVVDGRAHLVLAGMAETKMVTSPILLMTESDGRIETLRTVYIRVKETATLADKPYVPQDGPTAAQELEAAAFLQETVGLDTLVEA